MKELRFSAITDLGEGEAFRQRLCSDRPQERLSEGFDHRFFLKSIVAINGVDKPIGMISIYENPGLKYGGLKTWCLGNFEWVGDESLVDNLFRVCESLARKNGIMALLGPMNGSTWKAYRFRDQGQAEAALFSGEKLHGENYGKLWAMHFPERHFYFSAVDRDQSAEAILSLRRQYELKGEVTVRPFDLNNWEDELKWLHGLCQKAFANNFLFTPIDMDEFMDQYKAAMPLVADGYTWLAESRGVPVGFLFAYRDRRNENQVILKTLARNPDEEFNGVGAMLVDHFFKNLKEGKTVIHALIHTEANSTAHAEAMGAEIYSTYSLFAKKLTEPSTLDFPPYGLDKLQ